MLALLGTAILIGFGAARGRSFRRVFLPTLAFGTSLLLSAYSWENLLYGFQVSFVGVLPFSVGAFVAMGSPSEGKRPLVVAGLCAIGAAGCLSSGVLTAPMCAAYAALARRPRRDVIALSIVSAAVFSAYLVGYDAPGHHANPAASILRPGAVLDYVAAYLGAPFTWHVQSDRVGPSRFFGYAGLAAWLVICAMGFRRRQDATSWVLPFVMTFAVATAVLTALGRLNFPAAQALESRYGTTAFAFWAALSGSFWREARTPRAEGAIGAIGCIAAIGIARAQEFEQTVGLARLEPLRPAETALLAGALEKATIDRISPAPFLVLEALPELRKQRLSVFHPGWVSWIGRPIRDFIRSRDDDACKGFLDRAWAVPAYAAPAFRVEGWAYSRSTGMAAKRIALIDEHDVVLGFALSGVQRLDVLVASPGALDRFTGFEGHIGSLHREGAQVSAVALLEGRVGCWLTSSRAVRESDAARLVGK
jgi:hypothetical protein